MHNFIMQISLPLQTSAVKKNKSLQSLRFGPQSDSSRKPQSNETSPETQQNVHHKVYLQTKFRDTSSRFPVLNMINQQVLQLHNIEGGHHSRKSSAIWKYIPGEKGEVDLDKTVNQAQFADKFESLYQTALRLYTSIEESIKGKYKHLLQLFQQLALLIEDFTPNKQTNINAYFIQLFAQTSSVIQMFTLLNQQKPNLQGYLKLTDQKSPNDTSRISNPKYDRQEELNHLQNRNLELHINNQRLAQEIDMLSKKLQSIEQDVDVVSLRKRMDAYQSESVQKIEMLQKDQVQRERTITKQTQVVSQLKSTVQRLESEVQALHRHQNENKVEFDQMKSTYEDIKKKYDHWREIAMMSREDLDLQHAKFKRFVEEESTSRQKLIKLQNKIDRLTIERSKEVEIPEDNNQKKDAQKLKELSQLFSSDRTFMVMLRESVEKELMRRARLTQDSSSPLKKRTSVADSTAALNSDYVELQKYSYARQNFLIFFEHQTKTIEMEMRNMQTRRIQMTFFGTVRALLDSYYNELMYVQDFHHASRFIDFAYAWISNFQLSKETRKVYILDPNEANSVKHEDVKFQFLLDILNPKMDKLWEIIAFKEFLFEQSSTDEIYFYLHCRNMMFRGPCLSNRKASFEVIRYVKVEHAEFIVHLVMGNYDEMNVLQVKRIIRDKARKLAQTGIWIDAFFVLRILLEFYKVERKNRLKMLREMFATCQGLMSNGKFGVNFKNFKKIFEVNFPQATDIQMCQLFRDSYMVGNGGVTSESFYAAATDMHFFIKYLQLKSLNTPPKMSNEGDKIEYSEENFAYIEFYTKYEKIQPNMLKMLRNTIVELGLEGVFKELMRIEAEIKNQFQDPWQRRSLISNIQQFLFLWTRVRNVRVEQQFLRTNQNNLVIEFIRDNYEYIHTIGGFDKDFYKIKQSPINSVPEFELVRHDLQVLEGLLNSLRVCERQVRLQEVSENARIKPLQKAARKRISKFYNFMGSVLNAKLKS